MNVDNQIEQLVGQMKETAKQLRWLRTRKAVLERLNGDGVYTGRSIDFDHLKHKDVIQVIRTLGGKWKKTAGAEDGKIDYTADIDGVRVRCWAGEPPPSCRIVEVEQEVPEKVIPAHTVKVKKMICTPASEPLAFAIAQKQTTNNS